MHDEIKQEEATIRHSNGTVAKGMCSYRAPRDGSVGWHGVIAVSGLEGWPAVPTDAVLDLPNGRSCGIIVTQVQFSAQTEAIDLEFAGDGTPP